MGAIMHVTCSFQTLENTLGPAESTMGVTSPYVHMATFFGFAVTASVFATESDARTTALSKSFTLS